MMTSEIPNQEQSKKGHFPRWVIPIILTAAFMLFHVIAPWGLSLLAIRYGWTDGRPGIWNLLGLILVVPGIAATIWMITLHFRASPDTFLEFQQSRKLITPGPYAFSRNPMYVVELVFWFGWSVFYGSIPVFIGCLLWFALFNFILVPREEQDLEKRFGEAYCQYKHNENYLS